jgi:hypothetical protein
MESRVVRGEWGYGALNVSLKIRMVAPWFIVLNYMFSVVHYCVLSLSYFVKYY